MFALISGLELHVCTRGSCLRCDRRGCGLGVLLGGHKVRIVVILEKGTLKGLFVEQLLPFICRWKTSTYLGEHMGIYMTMAAYVGSSLVIWVTPFYNN